MNPIKRILRSLIRETDLGVLDYFRFSASSDVHGGPFNNQPYRQALFHALMQQFKPSVIVETGTYRGTTTEFMSNVGVPVFTAEYNPRNFGFARTRLRGRRNVTIQCGDSRAALRSWLDGPLRAISGQTIFFYLDAHWYADLPLGEELSIIFDRCPNALVMIDDFQVPYDSGYGYDKDGPGEPLTPEYIAPAIAANNLCVHYPSTPSSMEGGWRSGCVVLAKNDAHCSVLASLPLLRTIELVTAS